MENDYLIMNDCCPALTAPSRDEEKELAILYLDIRNFTGLMEAQPQRAVIEVMRRLFTAFNQITKNLQGKVVEIAGDSLYAVFGLQSNLREAANQAYQAAKMMFRTVDLFNNAYAEPYNGSPLELGIGLHVGKVFVGEFGLDGPGQLSVMGLPVNIASRLQAKTKELNNDLLVSEEAYRLLETEGNEFHLQAVRLQGVTGEQEIRLAGKPYQGNRYLNSTKPDMDYLLAISG